MLFFVRVVVVVSFIAVSAIFVLVSVSVFEIFAYSSFVGHFAGPIVRPIVM